MHNIHSFIGWVHAFLLPSCSAFPLYHLYVNNAEVADDKTGILLLHDQHGTKHCLSVCLSLLSCMTCCHSAIIVS